MKHNFADRASYLAWREEWKATYAKLTAEIRAQKRARKQYLRTYERIETPQGKARRLISKVDNPEYNGMAFYNLIDLRFMASTQMESLKEAKEISWKLKQATREAAAAA